MLPIKNILDSLRDDVLSGKITLHEAAEELHESGWTNFIDEDATRKDPLLLALIDFSRVYTHFLVSNTADYNAAPWGTI